MQAHSEKGMVDLFVKMEQELPVHQYVIDGIKIWPYLRLSIKNKLDSFFLVNGGYQSKPRLQPTFTQKLKQTVNTFFSAVKLTTKALLRFPFGLYFSSQRVDFLMFCFNSSFLSVGEKEINRNLIGILQGLEASGNNRYQVWEYTSLADVKTKSEFPGFNMAPLSAALNEWCRFRIALSGLFKQSEYDFVEQINEYLESHDFPIKLESYKLRHEVRRIEQMARILERFIVRHQVQKVINVCYYGYVGMAVNQACYRQKRLSIEYQHGIQTQYHPMYSNWQNVPPEGYELLPEEFWVWGQATNNVIADWVNEQSFHKVKTVGNAWLEFFRQQLAQNQSLTEAQEQRYAGKKLILVSLQAYPEHYRSHVTEAMKQSEEDWLWILKEHPRFQLTPEQLQAEFGNLVTDGTVVLERDFTIYEMLTLLPINVHLTAFSTVAFECEYYGVPTVFFHENGIDGNAELINTAQHLFAADNADNLVESIKQALSLTQIQPIYMAKEITAVDKLLKDVA